MGVDKVRLEVLDEMQYLLERMLELAEFSAGDSCSDAQRAKLQNGFDLLRGLLDNAADQYKRGKLKE